MIWRVYMHLVSAVFLSVASFICGLAGASLLMSDTSFLIEWEFCFFTSCLLVMSLIFDWMSMIFCSFVLLISLAVLFYSGEYMKGDGSLNRFMYLVLAFVLSMVLLIVSPNLISILLGWDGLGLVSYALVIYYQNEKSANSGMLTVLSNRVGDVAILLSIALMMKLESWDSLFYCSYVEDSKSLLLKALVVSAAMTKSAQIPFSAWLPAATAAPTPVSARTCLKRNARGRHAVRGSVTGSGMTEPGSGAMLNVVWLSGLSSMCWSGLLMCSDMSLTKSICLTKVEGSSGWGDQGVDGSMEWSSLWGTGFERPGWLKACNG